jgi:hypothetical protein
MSAWTLKKIKACEEIKFGTMFRNEYGNAIVVSKMGVNGFCGFEFMQEGQEVLDRYSSYNGEYPEFHFYRPDGSEILPPEDKPKERRLYAWIDRDNRHEAAFVFYTLNSDVVGLERASEWDIVKSEGV